MGLVDYSLQPSSTPSTPTPGVGGSGTSFRQSTVKSVAGEFLDPNDLNIDGNVNPLLPGLLDDFGDQDPELSPYARDEKGEGEDDGDAGSGTEDEIDEGDGINTGVCESDFGAVGGRLTGAPELASVSMSPPSTAASPLAAGLVGSSGGSATVATGSTVAAAAAVAPKTARCKSCGQMISRSMDVSFLFLFQLYLFIIFDLLIL